MKTRVISAIVLLAIFIPILCFGGLPFAILMSIIAVMALHELLKLLYIDTLFVDKAQELRDEKGIKLCALKGANSKNHLPKEFRNMISKLCRRIQTMFNQMIEHFDIIC